MKQIYFTNAIGKTKPGIAFIKADSYNHAKQLILSYIKLNNLKLFKRKVIVGNELDEIDFDILLVHLNIFNNLNIFNENEIDIINI